MRQPLLQHQRRRRKHHRHPNAVGDKVGRVVGKHYLLAQHAIRKRRECATSAASLSAVGITSSSCIYRGGLKKCVPKNRSRCDFSPAAIFAIGKPEVLVRQHRLGRQVRRDAIQQRSS